MIIRIDGWISVEGGLQPAHRVELHVTLPDIFAQLADMLAAALRRGQ